MGIRRAAVALLMLMAIAIGSPSRAAPARSDPGPDVEPRVYIFRGDLGIFFSTGMDLLGAELNQHGLTAGVYNWETGRRSPMTRSPTTGHTRVAPASCWRAIRAAAMGL